MANPSRITLQTASSPLPASKPHRLSFKRFFQGEGPETGPITLVQRRVYILPSKMGIYFATMMFVMLLGAVNYTNNLAFALTFLMASISLVSILHCYRNLLSLRVDVGPIPSVFCGDTVQVPMILDNQQHAARYALKLQFYQDKRQESPEFQSYIFTDVGADQRQRCNVPVRTQQRGLYPLPRVTLRSSFPLGLFQTWAHAQRDAHYLVYPAPTQKHDLPNAPSVHTHLSGDRGKGADDFAGLRTYHHGDSLRHVHWKAVAREQGMFTKQFGGDRSEELWLDWESLPGMDTETRLSRLCRWVIDADASQLNYGLRIPGAMVPLGTGPGHRHHCLKALALFNADANVSNDVSSNVSSTGSTP
ncbi:MAG: DUF58 domain-containing protein [Ectothiorhodospiraceae bacterium]|nr:DUF58 domain-containing protein [Ectothiorhodospiraceae bacterium]